MYMCIGPVKSGGPSTEMYSTWNCKIEEGDTNQRSISNFKLFVSDYGVVKDWP